MSHQVPNNVVVFFFVDNSLPAQRTDLVYFKFNDISAQFFLRQTTTVSIIRELNCCYRKLVVSEEISDDDSFVRSMSFSTLNETNDDNTKNSRL